MPCSALLNLILAKPCSNCSLGGDILRRSSTICGALVPSDMRLATAYAKDYVFARSRLHTMLCLTTSAMSACARRFWSSWEKLRLAEIESGRNRVLGRVADLPVDSWTERRVPSPECILPLLVEYAGSDLKQEMCSALTPPHLLAFYHSLADHLIDC